MSNPEPGCSPFEQIQTLYTELALRPDQTFGWSKGKDNSRQLGYQEEWLTQLPECVWESSAAVGNPFALGPVFPGETLVDIGCGAGADSCIAGLLVGDSGRVIGIDATAAMVAKARANAHTVDLKQVEFHQLDMTDLSSVLPDAVADIAISNGAINLAIDKKPVFAEIFRILRKGGRFQFADMVNNGTMPRCCSEHTWADCVSGTLAVEEINTLLQQVGFIDVQWVEFTGYQTSSSTIGATFRAQKP